MSDIEAMEAELAELKQKQKECKAKTLNNLDKLYTLLNGSDKNSEEKIAAIADPAAQV
jgi:hypothetical protein